MINIYKGSSLIKHYSPDKYEFYSCPAIHPAVSNDHGIMDNDYYLVTGIVDFGHPNAKITLRLVKVNIYED